MRRGGDGANALLDISAHGNEGQSWHGHKPMCRRADKAIEQKS